MCMVYFQCFKHVFLFLPVFSMLLWIHTQGMCVLYCWVIFFLPTYLPYFSVARYANTTTTTKWGGGWALESGLLMLLRIWPQLLSLRLRLWPSESGTSEIVAKRGQTFLATLSDERVQQWGLCETPLCLQCEVYPGKTRDFRTACFRSLKERCNIEVRVIRSFYFLDSVRKKGHDCFWVAPFKTISRIINSRYNSHVGCAEHTWRGEQLGTSTAPRAAILGGR